jgi:Type II secretion system (T2SS), protein K
MRIQHGDQSRLRSGVVLIAVLIIVVLLMLAAFQFSELMQQEYAAAHSSLTSMQARASADSGVSHFAAMVADKDTLTSTLANNPYDNESFFSQQQVRAGSDTQQTGRFSLVSPIDKDDPNAGQLFRYGAVDEAGKININALVSQNPDVAQRMLMKLPNMTEDIADSIVNWISTTDSARPNGANDSYYEGLAPAQRRKNGPLDTIEELLLVRGVTPRLLFGTDYNRNGMQDPGEDDGSGWDPGWAAYLTVYSRERNVDNDGTARINLNDSDLTKLHDSLTKSVSQSFADFVILYRTQAGGSGGSPSQGMPAQITMQNGGSGGTIRLTIVVQPSPAQGQSSGGGSAASQQQITDQIAKAMKQSPTKQIGSRSELIDASTSFSVGSGQMQRQVSMQSPLASKNSSSLQQLLPIVFDKTTTQNAAELPARINVLTAPKTVLNCFADVIGQVNATEVDSIIAQRPAPGEATDLAHQTPAWLLIDGILTKEKLGALEQYITARTQVYRVQSVGFFDEGGPISRVEAVVDTNDGKPRIVMWRDLSDLGRGFDFKKP